MDMKIDPEWLRKAAEAEGQIEGGIGVGGLYCAMIEARKKELQAFIDDAEVYGDVLWEAAGQVNMGEMPNPAALSEAWGWIRKQVKRATKERDSLTLESVLGPRGGGDRDGMG